MRRQKRLSAEGEIDIKMDFDARLLKNLAEPNISKRLKIHGSAKCSTVIAENIFEVKFAVDLVGLLFISACFIYP